MSLRQRSVTPARAITMVLYRSLSSKGLSILYKSFPNENLLGERPLSVLERENSHSESELHRRKFHCIKESSHTLNAAPNSFTQVHEETPLRT